jgi:hypothetical protein
MLDNVDYHAFEMKRLPVNLGWQGGAKEELMKLTPAQIQGVAGAKLVAARVATSLGWACREQPQELDTGVDVTIEIVEGDEATGVLFGAQIKSGESFFKELPTLTHAVSGHRSLAAWTRRAAAR